MLSYFELNLIEIYAKLSSSVVALGLDWNPKTKLLTSTNSHKLKYYINILFHIFGFLIVCNCTVRLHATLVKSSSSSPTEQGGGQGGNDVGIVLKVIYVFLFLVELGLFLCNFVFSCRREALVHLYNQMLVYSRKEYQKEIQNDALITTKRSRNLKYCQHIFTTAAISAFVAIMLLEYHYIAAMQNESTKVFNLVSMILILLLYFIPAAIFCGLLQMYLFHYYVIISDGLKINLDQNAAAGIPNIIHHYKCLSLLCHFFNSTFSKELIPACKYFPSIVGMMCFYLAVRIKNNAELDWVLKICMNLVFINLVIYLWAIVNLGAILMSSFWSRSIGFIKHVKEEMYNTSDDKGTGRRLLGKDKKGMYACVASLAPLRFKVGGIYYMEKEAKLTLISFIVNGTLNLLLAFP